MLASGLYAYDYQANCFTNNFYSEPIFPINEVFRQQHIIQHEFLAMARTLCRLGLQHDEQVFLFPLIVLASGTYMYVYLYLFNADMLRLCKTFLVWSHSVCKTFLLWSHNLCKTFPVWSHRRDSVLSRPTFHSTITSWVRERPLSISVTLHGYIW